MAKEKRTGRSDWGMKMLKMPMFDGEDAYGWNFRAERYFMTLGMTEEEKMQAALICLEGRALAWYQWAEERKHIRCWLEFRDLLLDRFKVVREGTHHEQFLSLVQKGSVVEYRDSFCP